MVEEVGGWVGGWAGGGGCACTCAEAASHCRGSTTASRRANCLPLLPDPPASSVIRSASNVFSAACLPACLPACCRRRRSVSLRRSRTCWSTTCSGQPTHRWGGCGLRVVGNVCGCAGVWVGVLGGRQEGIVTGSPPACRRHSWPSCGPTLCATACAAERGGAAAGGRP
jgi:hypothetical protein